MDGMNMHDDPALLAGFDKSEDACVYKITEDLAIAQTVDFFPPIVDDPYTFGAIAACNSLSDIYAMGGEPKTCLNIMGVPEEMDKFHVREILRGGYDKVYEAGAVIAGGHTIIDPEPKYGLCVTGFVHPETFFRNNGAKPGDVLILTKPIGIGLITTAAKADMASEEGLALAIKCMTELNKNARDVLVKYKVHACTDVTGFGFMGHLYEMIIGSEVAAEIYSSEVDIIPESLDLASMGMIPAGAYRNRSYCDFAVDAGDVPVSVQDVMYDPQTSGGLLAAVAAEDADACLEELKGKVISAQRVGKVIEYEGGKSIFLL